MLRKDTEKFSITTRPVNRVCRKKISVALLKGVAFMSINPVNRSRSYLKAPMQFAKPMTDLEVEETLASMTHFQLLELFSTIPDVWREIANSKWKPENSRKLGCNDL